MVFPTDRGEHVTANPFIFLCCVAEDALFGAYRVFFSAEERGIQNPSPSHYYSHIYLAFSYSIF